MADGYKWQQRIRAGHAKYDVQLEKLPRSSETCSKNIHLTVNHENFAQKNERKLELKIEDLDRVGNLSEKLRKCRDFEY